MVAWVTVTLWVMAATLSDVESKNSESKSKKKGKFMAFTTSLVEERVAVERFCEFNL